MRKKLKIYVIGAGNYTSSYTRFFRNFERVKEIGDADLVILTGGADVDPSFYGAEKHPTTFSQPSRDKEEIDELRKVRPDQLVYGCCRGLTKAHVKQGELSGTLKCQPAAKPEEETHRKVQRLGIETKFLPMRKYVSNIPKRALTVKMI